MTTRKRKDDSLNSKIRELEKERKKVKAEIKRREKIMYPVRSELYARIRETWLRERGRSRLYLIPQKDGEPPEVDMTRLPIEPRKTKAKYTKLTFHDDDGGGVANDEEEVDPGEEFADKTVDHGIDRGEYAMA